MVLQDALHFSFPDSSTNSRRSDIQDPYRCKAPVGQTGIHRQQWRHAPLSTGVPTLIMPFESGTGEMRSHGHALRHLSHLMQRERNSSSTIAPGGRLNLKSFGSRVRIRPPRATIPRPFPTRPIKARRFNNERGLSPSSIPTAILIEGLLAKLGRINSSVEYPVNL
jgi:hypothetical protein